jgi:hypothetical protein
MPIHSTSSFPPLESMPPPKPSSAKRFVSAVVFVLLLGAAWLALRIADLSFLTGALLER